MAGGTWNKLAGKERPGTYINFTTVKTGSLGISERGIVMLPLIGFSYGPTGEFISISNSSPDSAYEKLGYSVYDPQMLLVKEALKCAKTCIVYIPTEGTKASGEVSLGSATLTGTAMYGGSRGNDLAFDCVANENDSYDVTVYLDNTVQEILENLTTVADLQAAGSQWITFTADDTEAALTDFSAISLTGGEDGAATTQDIVAFLDAAERMTWNTLAFPVEDQSLIATVVSKIKYLREDVGKYRKAVVADYASDYEGIINVVNSYKLNDGTELTNAQATAWVAGADAGADCVTSLTYKAVDDAADIIGLMSNAEAEQAIRDGKFFFSFNEQSEVVVEYDINSLVSYNDGNKAKSWRKNRVLRTMDSIAESIMENFPPNRYDNDEEGWDIMEGVGKAILKLYGPRGDGGVGALSNIDYDADFKVDREQSSGDEVYINVGIQPTDSAEKLFFTIITR